AHEAARRRSQAADRSGQRPRIALARVPRGDEACRVAVPIVESETLRAQYVALVRGAAQENFVGFHRMEQSIPGRTRYLASSGIGGTRIRQPEVALEHRQHLRREKAALRLEVTR